MTIGFKLITFGNGMKAYANSTEFYFGNGDLQNQVNNKLTTLYTKRHPFLRDYYALHRSSLFKNYWVMGIENEEIELRSVLGLISYSLPIIPFDEQTWDNVQNNSMD